MIDGGQTLVMRRIESGAGLSACLAQAHSAYPDAWRRTRRYADFFQYE
jgi:hypothetical protein